MKACGKKTLGVCMIIKDEEKNLPNILNDLKAFADQIVVADTGSTDASMDIARRSGAKVIKTAWKGDFAKARNFSLSYVNTDWVMWVDGDDRISREEGEKIKTLIDDAPPEICFRFKILNVNTMGHETPFMQLRLFPRDKRILFKNKIHESAAQSAKDAGYRFKDAQVTVRHMGYSTPKLVVEKIKRNIEYLRVELKNNPFSITTRYLYASSLRELGELKPALGEFQRIIEDKKGEEAHSEIYNQSFTETARILSRLGSCEQALSVIQEAVSRNSEDVNTMALAAEIFLNNGDDEKAEGFFVKALTLEQKVTSIPVDYYSIRIYCIKSLCSILKNQKRLGDIEKILLGEMKASPDSPEIMLLLGDFFMEQQKPEQGRDIYRKAMERFPNQSIFTQRFKKHGPVLEPREPSPADSAMQAVSLINPNAGKVLAICLEKENLKTALESHKVTSFEIIAACDELPQKKYDAVILDWAVNFNQEPESLLYKYIENLNPEGQLIIHIRNPQYLGNICNLARGKLPSGDLGNGVNAGGRQYTYPAIKNVLKQAGFRIIREGNDIDRNYMTFDRNPSIIKTSEYILDIRDLSAAEIQKFFISSYYFVLIPFKDHKNDSVLSRMAQKAGKNRARELNMQGLRLITEKKYIEASNCFFQVLEIDKKNVSAFNNLGLIAWYMGNIEDAYDMFLTSLKLDDSFEDALFNIWDAALKLNRQQETLDIMRVCVEKHPDLIRIKDLLDKYG
ncbi:MAG: glycosyltransferase [bacterium]